MDWNVMGGMMWTAMLVSSIVGLALILLLIAAIVWFVRQLGQVWHLRVLGVKPAWNAPLSFPAAAHRRSVSQDKGTA